MRELGYNEGKNVAFEPRYAGGKFERLPALAEELVRLKVAAIVTSGGVTLRAAMKVTTTVPIVIATGDDPAAAGLVPSLARPGGNVTGVTSLGVGLTAKRFELLREVVPNLSRLAVLRNVNNPTIDLATFSAMRELITATDTAKVTLLRTGVSGGKDLPAAFAAMTRERAQAVFVIADPMLYAERRRVGDLALKHGLPSISGVVDYVEAGGLVSYGPSYANLFRRTAVYVDKILKGAKPGDLPIEQPTHVSLVVNLKTAKALGVTIPRPILLRAERVIE
jgi:putative ABC transport system substrate-binding protein